MQLTTDTTPAHTTLRAHMPNDVVALKFVQPATAKHCQFIRHGYASRLMTRTKAYAAATSVASDWMTATMASVRTL